MSAHETYWKTKQGSGVQNLDNYPQIYFNKLTKFVFTYGAPFNLLVKYNDTELSFPSHLVTFGYTYTFYVLIDNHEIIFERDEESNLRAIASILDTQIDVKLLEAIGVSLEKREFLQTVF